MLEKAFVDIEDTHTLTLSKIPYYSSIFKYFAFSILNMSSIDNIDWTQVIKKEARGIGGIGDDDLGEIQEIQNNNVITKVGFVDKATYSIPKNLIDKFDGHTVWFRLTKEDAESQYKTGD